MNDILCERRSASQRAIVAVFIRSALYACISRIEENSPRWQPRFNHAACKVINQCLDIDG